MFDATIDTIESNRVMRYSVTRNATALTREKSWVVRYGGLLILFFLTELIAA